MGLVLNNNESWSIVNKIVNLVANGIILFMIAKILSSDDVALWYLFGAIFAIVGIMEGGFLQTISRHITYIINKKESHLDLDCNEFIKINNRVFVKIVVAIAVIALLGGSFYLSQYKRIEVCWQEYIAWGIFVISGTVGLLSNLHSSILLGFQKVVIVQKNQIISTLANLFLVFLFLEVFKWEYLISFVLCFGLSRVLLFVLNLRKSKLCYNISETKSGKEHILRKLVVDDMKKMLINIISFNLLTSVFYMLMATYVSVDLLASLGFTTQILNYVGGFTSILLSSNIPYFAALFSMNRLKYLNGIVIRRGVTSMTCYIVVVLIFVFLFPYLQKIMDLKINILSGNILYSFLFFMTMEYGIGLLGIYLLVCNELRLMIVSLMVSTLILLITFVLMQMKVGVSLIFIVRGIIVLVLLYIPAVYFVRKIVDSN
jgi:hypothetical protein